MMKSVVVRNLFIAFGLTCSTSASADFQLNDFKSRLTNAIHENKLPSSISIGNDKYDIQYTTNAELTAYIQKVLKQYSSDYTAVSVIDNQTGEILAAVDYSSKTKQTGVELAFTSSHPSASIIKVITATELISNPKINIDTDFTFSGRSTTLYKSQLSDRRGRWSRRQNLGNAFAVSNNVIFAKAAISFLTGEDIWTMANKFGFNKNLMSEVDLPKSYLAVAKDKYDLAEIASGYNDVTQMSPIHASLIPSIIANNGVARYPRIVKKITNSKTGEVVYTGQVREEKVLDEKITNEMREMMRMTIIKGTGRKGFARFDRYIKDKVEVGGKSGHLTGGVPFGKRDWFAVYAMPKGGSVGGRGISLAVMNVNVKRWKVKSSHLTKGIIEYYYKNIVPLKNTQASRHQTYTYNVSKR